MNLGNGAFTKVACCHEEDEERAVRSLAEQIGGQEEDTLLFFCSSHYNLEVVQSAIREQFPCTIVGCTTSGEISDAYSKHTLAATLLPREYFACQTLLISSLSEMGSALPDAFKLEFLN
ncbi:MAG: hypothetical protein KDD62_10525 [Bdellovibrionales bacterium]|nr:hypothetical protein [Bdellovibrionales bacterium]